MNKAEFSNRAPGPRTLSTSPDSMQGQQHCYLIWASGVSFCSKITHNKRLWGRYSVPTSGVAWGKSLIGTRFAQSRVCRFLHWPCIGEVWNPHKTCVTRLSFSRKASGETSRSVWHQPWHQYCPPGSPLFLPCSQGWCILAVRFFARRGMNGHNFPQYFLLPVDHPLTVIRPRASCSRHMHTCLPHTRFQLDSKQRSCAKLPSRAWSSCGLWPFNSGILGSSCWGTCSSRPSPRTWKAGQNPGEYQMRVLVRSHYWAGSLSRRRSAVETPHEYASGARPAIPLRTLLAALDTTIVSIAIPYLWTQLPALNDAGWQRSAQLTMSTALQPAGGTIYNFF